MSKPVKLPFTYISLFVLLFINLISCDFVYEKQVTGKYYIIGVDTETDLKLGYKLRSGDYVGRAPGQILQFGFNDTFLIAKTKENINSQSVYYIIDMTKDHEYAKEETFRAGPLTEEVFNKTWKQKLNIQLRDVK
jgi:hypothetical protein